MQRRDFLTGAVAVGAGVVFTSGKLLADEGKGEPPIRLKSKDSPSALEQGHVPLVDVPDKVKAGQWIDVNVKVGFMKEHPSTPEHWIRYVSLLADGKEIAKVERNVGGIVSASATFKIKLDKSVKLEAIQNCNLHGTWISEAVKVEVS
ncbi:MAG: desulfoferrodoxin [Nitrospirae bacterium]|nr:desulfoferrodoxin [Nitrospirota bacterium]MBF0591051.1 desulfoferrodoxin [Nitrospirota bacterium]